MARLARILPVVLLVAGGITGCDEADVFPSGPAATLAGTAWRAISVGGKLPVAAHEPWITFTTDQVTGSGGCNGFGGTYTFVNGILKFGEIATTLALCDGPVGSIESSFGEVLRTVRSVSIDASGQLLIDGTAGQVLFVPTTR
jgi:heat shock protein HslJ